MYFFFKGIRESEVEFNKDFPGGENYWTAEMGLGYTLVHYPVFLLEMILEAAAIVSVLYLWHR